jgi:hypothetical protein
MSSQRNWNINCMFLGLFSNIIMYIGRYTFYRKKYASSFFFCSFIRLCSLNIWFNFCHNSENRSNLICLQFHGKSLPVISFPSRSQNASRRRLYIYSISIIPINNLEYSHKKKIQCIAATTIWFSCWLHYFQTSSHQFELKCSVIVDDDV